MTHQGKVALVTGASRGLGRAIAVRLAEEGAAVVVNYLQSEAAAAEVVSQIGAFGGEALSVQADVRDEDQMVRMVGAAIGKFGRIDLLVNNAGIIWPPRQHQSFWETPVARWDDIMAVDLRGPFLCSKHVAKHLIERGAKGSILNLSSVIGAIVAMPFAGVEYHAAKAGVVGLTFGTAGELAPYGITVNALAPGAFPTDMAPHLKRPEVASRRALSIPVGRIGALEDVAGAASFLLSDAASFITGQVIVVDGGFTRIA
ncbi:MAG: 3-oxoacyl-ACP reductase family protein [Dehalococcoidia bacterium]